MKNKIYQTFDEAVADVPDGSVFMSPALGASAYRAACSLPSIVRVPKT